MFITSDGFIEIAITPSMTATANIKAAEMGLLRNSIREGEGNTAGFLGEEVVCAAFDGSISNNTFDYDIKWGDMTLEVKTKDRTVPPRPDYDASVAKYNTTQKADFYVFVSLWRFNTGILDMQRAASIVGGSSDIFRDSLVALENVLNRLSHEENERARTMLRLYQLSPKTEPHVLLPRIVNAVRRTHKEIESQHEAMRYFGINPLLVDTYTRGYVCGLIPKSDYKKNARFLKKGDTDPSNGWVVSADCFNVCYDLLERFN